MSFLKLKQPIYIACDHGGFEIKKSIINTFKELNFEDLGCYSTNSIDYPDFAHKLTQTISKQSNSNDNDPEAMGLLICGSGQGMAMSANKNKTIRAALCWNEESAELSRSHNNAQVLCLGARLLKEDDIMKIIKVFFSTSFEAGRHLKRINKI